MKLKTGRRRLRLSRFNLKPKNNISKDKEEIIEIGKGLTRKTQMLNINKVEIIKNSRWDLDITQIRINLIKKDLTLK